MGWWSGDVLGGDPPLDYIATIEERLGVEDLYPLDGLSADGRRELAAKLEPGLVEAMRVEFGQQEYDSEIALQVLGVVVMASGVAMSDELRASVIWAAANDEWAQEDEGRRAAMDDLTAAAQDYKAGAPVVLAHTGLFEAIALGLGEVCP